MKFAMKSQANRFVASDACIVWENNLGSPKVSNAVTEVNGRYPAKGWVVNELCDELAYVLEGTGKLLMPGQSIDLEPGATMLIEAGEKFAWEGTALRVFIPCIPAWQPGQHHVVDAE